MPIDKALRRLRGALGNALIWGAGWSAVALAGFVALAIFGVLPETVTWTDGLGMALRFGVIGGIAGGAFSSVIRFLYHGRRLSDINWIRFGVGGAVATGLFVPAFLLTMNLLSGDGLLSLKTLVENGFLAAAFGGAAAATTLRLAQRADKALPDAGRDPDRLT